MTIAADLLKNIIEAALLAAGKPLNVAQIQALFDDHEKPGKGEIEAAVEDIRTDMGERGFDLVEVASGWRFQVRENMAPWVGRLWEEKPQKYSRALLETLALVAYRQPITRGEIEEIRGVAVSSHIMKTLQERQWVKIVGHRDVPGRPAMYATTRDFLDYFSLKSLDQLPTLAEIRDLDTLNQELNLAMEEEGGNSETSAEGQNNSSPQDENTDKPDQQQATESEQSAADDETDVDSNSTQESSS